MSARSTRARRWTWTLNSPTAEEIEKIQSITTGQVKFLVYGEEVAPTTQRAHLQGYVEFASLKTLRQVKELISERVHLEKSRGTGKENLEYCTKEGRNIFKIGEIGLGQGSRTDMQHIQQMIQEGASDLEIANLYFGTWTRCRTAIREYRKMVFLRKVTPRFSLDSFPPQWQMLVEDSEVKSVVLWGESGIGKTEFAKALFPDSLMVRHIDDLADFKSDEHSSIIFDDMDFRHIPRTSQIHLTDWDEDSSIHIRYGVAFIPKNTRKIFTTNEYNGLIFIDDPAIKRRIRIINLVK